MNLEQVKSQKNNPNMIDDMDFDFKPITSGLGFHHQKTTDVKPIIVERTVTVSPVSATLNPKKEMNIYQNDLSMFYGKTDQVSSFSSEIKLNLPEEKIYRLAEKSQRFFAYFTDLLVVISILGLVLTVMARTISMDLTEVWSQYPNEITPLVLVLFCGFYLIYFSIFEMTNQTTLGKNIFGLRVVSMDNKPLSLTTLLMRSMIGLLNFISLGLFSYFDLQNKITSSKVIRID